MSYPKSTPLPTAPELVYHASDALEGVNEALLLGETEELLNCLEPAAFALSSSSSAAATATERSSTEPQVADALINIAIDEDATPTVRRRGRRSWKADATRNPSRERLQIELATLRQQASELETELTIARAHREELRRNKLLLIPTWERIAKRQHRARDTSEDENHRLKRLVASQRVFVTQLQHAWHRWQWMTSLDPYAAIDHVTVRFDATDPALFDVLTAELDLDYLRLDQVFQEAGLMKRNLEISTSSVAKSHQLSNDQVAPFLEVSIVEADTYDCNMLTHTAWEIIKNPTPQRNQIFYDDVQAPERTCARKMRVTAAYDGIDVALEVILVMRRYVEKDRTTNVWKCLLRADDGGREFSDTFTEQTGWVTMQSMASLDEPRIAGAGEDGTLSLTCVHIEPKRQLAVQKTRGNNEGSSGYDPLMSFVEKQFRSSFQRMNEMIEDRILGAVAE